MRYFIWVCMFVCISLSSQARFINKPIFSGLYLQWGYNLDKYSKSDIHFSDGSNYDFTMHAATATDKPDFSGLLDNPLQLTIPQYSYRVGAYLNKERTQALEFNFDHTKYVVRDNQYLRISGVMHGEPFDIDTLVTKDFIHFEHTNGANFYHLNYVGRSTILKNKKKDCDRISVIYKAGAGIVIPKSDVTLMGKSLDNKFHIAGYVLGAEAGFRYSPTRKFFFEVTGKGGFANYTDVLTIGTGRAKHHFFYGEAIFLVGYDIFFKGKPETK